MKKIITLLLIASFVYSCNSKSGNLIIKGKINNFQKGKVFLEKMHDTIIVKVDSVTLDGENSFVLSDNIDSPQIYYISISESDKYVPFFAEKGEITIISDMKTFGYKPLINGSKNQDLLDKYNDMNSKFTNLNLNLIKDRFDALKAKDSIKIIEIEKKIKNNEKRKYLYTINFAVNHAEYEVAPYLVLTQIPKANPKLLDTIQKAMSEKVRESLYGKQFIEFLNKK